MPECPACFGNGGISLAESNAILAEHLTDEELALVGGRDRDWMPCDECEETGVVSAARAAEMYTEASEHVRRAMAFVEIAEAYGG